MAYEGGVTGTPGLPHPHGYTYGLRRFSGIRTRHSFPIKLGMLLLRIQGDIKNVMKRGSHRASFHATIPTNTVVYVTFGNLRA